MIAESAVNVVNPSDVTPKQVKLLGAKVKGVGTITTVSEQNRWRWALIEDERGFEHHVFLCDLTKDMLELPSEQVAYRASFRRVGYGLYENVLEIESVPFSDLTHVDDLEAAA